MCVAACAPRKLRVRAGSVPLKMYKVDKSQIAEDILRYLTKHPRAQDTIEGISEWWLLEQDIGRRTAEVREAVAVLVSDGLIIESRNNDARPLYRINRRRYRQIQARLREGGKGIGSADGASGR
jgi:hypothetical protein